jgi:hypothetical protein
MSMYYHVCSVFTFLKKSLFRIICTRKSHAWLFVSSPTLETHTNLLKVVLLNFYINQWNIKNHICYFLSNSVKTKLWTFSAYEIITLFQIFYFVCVFYFWLKFNYFVSLSASNFITLFSCFLCFRLRRVDFTESVFYFILFVLCSMFRL